MCAGVSLMVFIAQLWLCRRLISNYFPTADDIAFAVTSTDISGSLNPLSWLTDGAHYYFQSYTEWQVAKTDFWRPLMNGFIWLQYQLFGQSWGDQLIVGYAEHALMVGLAGFVATRVLNLKRSLTLAVMLIAALNPAFWSFNDSYDAISRNSPPELLQYPVFQIELLCALLMMGAFITFVRGRYALYCLLATAALLLKETALTVPVATLVLVGAWKREDARRTASNLGWLLLPLIIWGAGRALTFHFGKDIYVLDSAGRWAWLLKPIRNVLLLPTILYRGPLRATLNALHAHDWRVLLLHAYQILGDLAWWLALLYAGFRAWQALGRRWLLSAPTPQIVALMFALGNLGLVMLLQAPDPRYLYFWFALGPAAIFAAFADRKYSIALPAALSLILVVPAWFSMRQALSADSLDNYLLIKHSGRQLTQLLAHTPSSVTTVYLVDDTVVQATASSYLAGFAGYGGRIVVVNSVTPMLGCHSTPATSSRYALRQAASSTKLDYTAPDCFYQLKEAPLADFDDRKDVKRGSSMVYHFPQMQMVDSRSVVSGGQYDVGKQWSLTVNDASCETPGACLWLGFDPQRQLYYPLN
jgi:hypothetical protein